MDISINNLNQPITTVQNSQINEVEKQVQGKEGTADQAETTYDAVSSEGDTLSISEEGKAAGANAKDQVVQLSGADSDGTVQQEANEVYFTDSDSSSSTINLSTYTETELKQMYLDGDITKLEYDEELSSREVTD